MPDAPKWELHGGQEMPVKKRVLSIAIIIAGAALAAWGAVVTAVLAWVFSAGDFSGEGVLSGFLISIGLLGLIPMSLGGVLLLQKNAIIGRLAGPVK